VTTPNSLIYPPQPAGASSAVNAAASPSDALISSFDVVEPTQENACCLILALMHDAFFAVDGTFQDCPDLINRRHLFLSLPANIHSVHLYTTTFPQKHKVIRDLLCIRDKLLFHSFLHADLLVAVSPPADVAFAFRSILSDLARSPSGDRWERNLCSVVRAYDNQLATPTTIRHMIRLQFGSPPSGVAVAGLAPATSDFPAKREVALLIDIIVGLSHFYSLHGLKGVEKLRYGPPSCLSVKTDNASTVYTDARIGYVAMVRDIVCGLLPGVYANTLTSIYHLVKPVFREQWSQEIGE
jgi:hypothetical protein